MQATSCLCKPLSRRQVPRHSQDQDNYEVLSRFDLQSRNDAHSWLRKPELLVWTSKFSQGVKDHLCVYTKNENGLLS